MRTAFSHPFQLADVVRALVDPSISDKSAALPEEVYRATVESEHGFNGRDARQLSVVIPWSLLQRDLNVGTSTAGGHLVGRPVSTARQSLLGSSAALQAGVEVVHVPAGAPVPGVPTVTAGGQLVAGFVTAEGVAVSQSDVVIGLNQTAPKTLGCFVDLTRRLALQGGPLVSALLMAELGIALSRGLDKAILQGSGASGNPQGLATAAGLFAQAGASLGLAGVQAMLEAVALGGAEDSSVRAIASPGVRKLLAARERAAGNGMLWDAGQLAGVPAGVSLQCPAATILAGDFSQVMLVIHGGVSVMVDPRLDVTGKHRVTALMDIDVLIRRPECFARATAVS